MEKHILHTREVDSTNDFLRVLVSDGTAKAPFCVSADHQTKGRGQRGNQWESQSGMNVLASFLVERKLSIEQLPLLNFASVLAVAQCLHAFGLREVFIKWPNDVYIEERKIAGVLIENALDQSGLKSSLIGIGLNVNQTQFSEQGICSMKAMTGRVFDRDEVLDKLYYALYDNVLHELESLRLWVNGMLYKQGETVKFRSNGRQFSAQVDSILADGKLLVKTEEGERMLEHHTTKWEHDTLH